MNTAGGMTKGKGAMKKSMPPVGMTHQQVKEIIRALTKRIELLEAMIGTPASEKHNDFAGPYPRRDQLPDNFPQFMKPNTHITN